MLPHFPGGNPFNVYPEGLQHLFTGIGRPVKSTLLSLSRDVIFFIPGLFLFSAQGGVTGMLWAAPVADLLSALLACILLYMEFRGQRKTMPEVMQSA